MKLAPIAFVVALLLAGCGDTTPTAAPPVPDPSNSPAARVDASASANVVQASPSPDAPSSPASAAPQATPSPDPEAVRTAAAAAYQAAGVANAQAFEALPAAVKHPDRHERDIAEVWDQYLVALHQLQVPADTAGDLRDLIRKVTRLQAAHREASAAVGAYSWNEPLPDAWWRARRHIRDRLANMEKAASRVRADLGLPNGCLDWDCIPLEPGDSYP